MLIFRFSIKLKFTRYGTEIVFLQLFILSFEKVKHATYNRIYRYANLNVLRARIL